MVRKKGMDQAELENLEWEVEILKELKHFHCLKLYDVFITNTYTYIITDLCTGGELFDYLSEKQSLSEKEASVIIKQIALALSYLHSKGIVHRDLKPENLLFIHKGSDAAIKLCDFGLARYVGNGLSAPCGTPTYVAPEVIKNDTKYGVACDWWSLGVILYLILCGFPPFWDDKPKRLFRKIKSGFVFFPSPYWDHVSRDARNLILGLLCVAPVARYNHKHVVQHQWIRKNVHEDDMPPDSRRAVRRYHIQLKMKRAVHTNVALVKLIAALSSETVETVIRLRNEKALDSLHLIRNEKLKKLQGIQSMP